MRLNYYYNFKNPIRFFINIENLNFANIDILKHSWSSPFVFRIRKDENSFRTLSIPNIYNFYGAYTYYNSELQKSGFDLENLEQLDKNHNRMSISYKTGDFLEKSYDYWLQKDYFNLIKFDVLLRYDIKSFYESIYTHYILKGKLKAHSRTSDTPLSHLNNGRTAGILMGNYLSTYMASILLLKISEEFSKRLRKSKLSNKCGFSYFSDDFYIFTNEEYIEQISRIFDEVLENFQLTKNESKLKRYNYIEYNNDDLIEKYWKHITDKCQRQQKYQMQLLEEKKIDKVDNLIFLNQLIYRSNKLKKYRDRRVFIVNFFKSDFFITTDFSSTNFHDYDVHQLLFLIKNYPEICLYIVDLLKSESLGNKKELINYLFDIFMRKLDTNFQDEQLYLFYLLYLLGERKKFKGKKCCEKILMTHNSILIAYCLKYKYITPAQILDDDINESRWLIYYYLILRDQDLYRNIDVSIRKYLIPQSVSKPVLEDAYLKFYRQNLEAKNDILEDITKVKENIKEYFEQKYGKKQ